MVVDGDGVPAGWSWLMERQVDEVWVDVPCFSLIPTLCRPPIKSCTELIPIWEAIKTKRFAVTPDGKGFDLKHSDMIIYSTPDGGRVMADDASHPEDNRPVINSDGDIEVFVERSIHPGDGKFVRVKTSEYESHAKYFCASKKPLFSKNPASIMGPGTVWECTCGRQWIVKLERGARIWKRKWIRAKY